VGGVTVSEGYHAVSAVAAVVLVAITRRCTSIRINRRWGVLRVNLYKIFFYVKALVWESLSPFPYPPSTCKAYPIAILGLTRTLLLRSAQNIHATQI